MNTQHVTRTLLCGLLLYTGLATAQEEVKDPDQGDDAIFYSGLAVQRMDADFDNLDQAINLGFNSGVTIPGLTWLGAEIAGSVTLIPGENSGGRDSQPILGGGGGGGGTPCTIDNPPTPPGCTPSGSGGGSNGGDSQQRLTQRSDDLQTFDIGVYAAIRTPGTFYATGKIGYRYLQSNIEELVDEDRSGTAYNLGVGYRYGSGLGGVELLYGRISSELDYIGLSLTYGFGTSAERRR